MHDVSQAARDAMVDTSVSALPNAIMEFNHSLLDDAYVNAPDNGHGDLFPKESIISQRYTASGLPRAVVGEATVQSKEDQIQFRAVSETDIYKYWISPNDSDSTGNITDAWVEVMCDHPRPTNKIVATFEVSFASPTSVDISIQQGGVWTKIGSELVPDSEGRVVTYSQGGFWSENYNIDNPINIEGVRVDVNTMSRSGVSAHIIDVAAIMRVDMSERIVSFDLSKNMENVSPFAPIGDASVNTANLSLENEDGALSPEDASQMFYGMLSRNVRVDLSATVEDFPAIDHGVFYSNSWNYSAPGVEIGVECSDVTRFMQEIFLQPFVLYNYTVTEAIREVLQRSGFNIYNFHVANDPVVPYIWYSERVSVWQALKDIANATLAYFYIGDHGEFQWEDFATLSQNEIVDTLDATHNIVDVEHSFDVVANSVSLEYNIYGVPRDPVSNKPVTQELWTAEQDEALLSSPLREPFGPTDTAISLSGWGAEIDVWPESGIVSIQGEYIRYGSINRSTRQLTDLTRGLNGSIPRDHQLADLGDYYTIGARGTQNMYQGNLRLNNQTRTSWYHYAMSLFGNNGTQHKVYGTRMRMMEKRHDTGGLIINQQGTHGGIYIELKSTAEATRRKKNEIIVYKRNPTTAELTVLGQAPYNVVVGNWYDIEVIATYTTVNPRFSVYVNGMEVTSFEEEWRVQGRYGPYIRGNSRIEFDRVYASDGQNTNIGGSTFQDVESGSSFSSEYMFHTGDPNIAINEFAPQIRQVKEYNIDYSVAPATQASVLNTNIWQARVMNFVPGPFGASFFVENKSGRTAVINGPSNLFEEEVTMHLLVYGNPIIIESEERKVVRDELAIRRHGLVELEVSNPWIQTDEMAENVADLIVQNFSEPMDTVSVTTIADHSLQLGDIVSLEYPEHGYHGTTHYYYVLGINTNWNNGFTQSLTLRRKR